MQTQPTARRAWFSLPTLAAPPGWLVPAVLGAALLIRIPIVVIAWAGVLPTTSDSHFYFLVARDLHRLISLSAAPSYAVTSIGPLYPLFLAPFLKLLPDSTAFASIRLTQAVLDTVAVWLVYRIALHIFNQRVAVVALLAQAFDLRFAYQAGNMITETLFMALFTAATLVYLMATSRLQRKWYVSAGLLLGLSILTRPVPLLLPVVLGIHAWLHPADRRRALSGFGWMVLAVILVLSPWTIRNAVIKGEFIPVSDTGFNHFWRAARDDGREITTDHALTQAAREDVGAAEGETGFTESGLAKAGVRYVLDAPARFAGRIISSTLAAYLQPYGTNFLLPPEGDSAKAIVLAFLQGEKSFSDVLNLPGLGRRILMYLWHYWGLIGGLAGMVLAWRKGYGWAMLPLVLWIAYGTAVSSVLLVEPRYLFPLMFAYTIFAAYATTRLWDAFNFARSRDESPALLPEEGWPQR